MTKREMVLVCVIVGLIGLWIHAGSRAYEQGRQSLEDGMHDFWFIEIRNSLHQSKKMLQMVKEHPGVFSQADIDGWRTQARSWCLHLEKIYIPYFRERRMPILPEVEEEVSKVRKLLKEPGSTPRK